MRGANTTLLSTGMPGGASAACKTWQDGSYALLAAWGGKVKSRVNSSKAQVQAPRSKPSPSAAGAAPGDPGKAQGRGPGAAGGTMRAIAIAILRPLREIYMFYYHVYYI